MKFQDISINHLKIDAGWVHEFGLKLNLYRRKGQALKRKGQWIYKPENKGSVVLIPECIDAVTHCFQCCVAIILLRLTVWPFYSLLQELEWRVLRWRYHE
jgi:hypothetical protein